MALKTVTSLPSSSEMYTLNSVIFYFVTHLAFFLESDREKNDRKGFSLWGSMNQLYIVQS